MLEHTHVHVAHDCSYSNRNCQCSWSNFEIVRRHVRKSRGTWPFIADLSESEQVNVFLYFIIHKQSYEPQVCSRGTLLGLPSADKNIRWQTCVFRAASAILESKNKRNGCDDEQEFSNVFQSGNAVQRRSQTSSIKRNKFETIIQSVQTVLRKYYCIPPDIIRDVIQITMISISHGIIVSMKSNFLSNLKLWFNKEGWNGHSGKNYFFNAIISIACNVGHVGRVNKTNQFTLQDAYNRKIVVGNEISMEDGAKEDFKKLCKGTAFNIREKY